MRRIPRVSYYEEDTKEAARGYYDCQIPNIPRLFWEGDFGIFVGDKYTGQLGHAFREIHFSLFREWLAAEGIEELASAYYPEPDIECSDLDTEYPDNALVLLIRFNDLTAVRNAYYRCMNEAVPLFHERRVKDADEQEVEDEV